MYSLYNCTVIVLWVVVEIVLYLKQYNVQTVLRPRSTRSATVELRRILMTSDTLKLECRVKQYSRNRCRAGAVSEYIPSVWSTYMYVGLFHSSSSEFYIQLKRNIYIYVCVYICDVTNQNEYVYMYFH